MKDIVCENIFKLFKTLTVIKVISLTASNIKMPANGPF